LLNLADNAGPSNAARVAAGFCHLAGSLHYNANIFLFAIYRMVKISRAALYKIATKYAKYPEFGGSKVIRGMGRAELLAVVRQMKRHPVHGRGVIQAIRDAAGRLVDRVKSALFFPPNKLPGGSQRLYNGWADRQINRIVIGREPVQGIIQKVINWISGGDYKRKLDELGYDTAYHLYMVLCFTDGSYLQLEKNARVTLSKSSGPPAGGITIDVKPPVTLGALFSVTLKAIGDHEFFQYSADKNNCQKFLNDVLRANGLSTAASTKFIMQDAKALIGTLSETQQALAQAATDLGGKLEQVTSGQGMQGGGTPNPRNRPATRGNSKRTA
jgi:hypothetical protein